MAYSKLYSRVNWENRPSTKTPLDEDNLNNMDRGVDDNDNRIVAMDQRIRNIEDIEPQFIAYMDRAETAADAAEGYADNAKDSQDAAKASENAAKASEDAAAQSESNAKASEKSSAENAANAAGSESNAKQSEIHAKESELNASASEMEAKNARDRAEAAESLAESARDTAISARDASMDSSLDSEAWAVGRRGGVDVLPDDATYENHSEWYAKRSSQYAAESKQSSEEAKSALDSIDERVMDALSGNIPIAWIDFNTGFLMWEGGRFIWTVNDDGYLVWEIS